jgi:DNA-binding MarR family transcriptional regulator
MTGLVRECEEMGLVTVEADAQDGRARIVRFTSKGAAMKRFLGGTMRDMEQQMQDCLGHGAYAGLRAALTKLSAMPDLVPRHAGSNADRR